MFARIKNKQYLCALNWSSVQEKLLFAELFRYRK